MKKKLALTTSNAPKPFFVYVRRRRELRMDVANVIVNGVELSKPAEMCEAFRKYFSSTFRKDEGIDPELNYSAISSTSSNFSSQEWELSADRRIIKSNKKHQVRFRYNSAILSHTCCRISNSWEFLSDYFPSFPNSQFTLSIRPILLFIKYRYTKSEQGWYIQSILILILQYRGKNTSTGIEPHSAFG